MPLVKLGVLISGSGSNLQSIIDHIEKGRISARIELVISNEAGAYGLTRAEKHGLKTMVLDHRDFKGRQDYDLRLADIFKEHGVELVVLAGFMRLLGPHFLKRFPHRVMNIHPALLPSFPGTHVWQKEVDHGVKFAGCTVHFVDEGMDTGPIIIQAVVPVLDGDDGDTLAQRILKQEHRIFPRAIDLFAQGRLSVKGRRVMVAPAGPGPEQDLGPISEEAVLVNPPLTEA